MSKQRKTPKWKMPLALRLLGSGFVILLLLLLGSVAVRFCMGLFVVGEDYIISLPGETSPVLSQPTEPTVSPETTGPETLSEVSRATITVTGDLMVHMPIVYSGQTEDGYNFEDVFRYVKKYVSDADYAVVNLETTLSGTENGKEYTGYPKFNSPDAIADGAKSAGFDMLLTANNHCNDYGSEGLLRTLEVLKERGIATLGTTSTAEEPHHAIKDVAGIKVGMINYTYGEIGSNRAQPVVNGLGIDSGAAGLVNVFDYRHLVLFYEEMQTHITDLEAKGAEVIVLFIHWGEELRTQTNDLQKAMAQKLCDLGVDVIAGSHPHVVQEVALLSSTKDPAHKTVCVYSMGNFLSNQRATNISLKTGHSEDSMLFTFTLVKYSDGTVYVESVDILPTWVLIRGSGNGRAYQILPLDTKTSDWQTAFEMDSNQAADAQASYNRTMELITDGLTRIQEVLAEEKTLRDEAVMGVG